MRNRLSILGCGLLWLTFVGIGAGQESTAATVDAPQISRLVEQLGSDSFFEREAATKQLQELGLAARAALKQAAQASPDAEVRARAAAILKVINAGQLQAIRQWNDHEDIVWCVQFSPNGKLLATGGGGRHKEGVWLPGSDFAVRIRDVQSGEVVKRLAGHTSTVNALQWTPDGKLLITASSDFTARIYRTDTWELVRALAEHTAAVSCASISADGKQVATGGWDRAILLWNLEDGRVLKRFPKQAGRIWDVAIARDGKQVAWCGDHPNIRLGNIERGEVARELTGHREAAVRLAWSPSGARLVSGGWDNQALLWDAEKGVVLKPLPHEGRVEGVAYSQDGTRVVTGSLDRRVRLWNATNGQLLHVYEGHTDCVTRVAIDPSGKLIASGGWDHSVRLWRIEDE